MLPVTRAPSSQVTPVPVRTTSIPKAVVKTIRTSTSPPRTTVALPTIPPKVAILYPAGPSLQFFSNSPVPSVPNMTLLSSAAGYPKVLSYPRPKEGRQNSKRPDSPFFTSPFLPVNLLPSKGLDLRQDGRFDTRLLAAAGKGTHSSQCARSSLKILSLFPPSSMIQLHVIMLLTFLLLLTTMPCLHSFTINLSAHLVFYLSPWFSADKCLCEREGSMLCMSSMQCECFLLPN